MTTEFLTADQLTAIIALVAKYNLTLNAYAPFVDVRIDSAGKDSDNVDIVATGIDGADSVAPAKAAELAIAYAKTDADDTVIDYVDIESNGATEIDAVVLAEFAAAIGNDFKVTVHGETASAPIEPSGDKYERYIKAAAALMTAGDASTFDVTSVGAEF